MRRILSAGSLLILFVSVSAPARATSVEYSLLSLGGDAYHYEYAITNDGSLGSGVAIRLFDLLFDPTQYVESSLVITTQPSLSAAWDQIILASAPGDPAAYDALALAAGIADGSTISGFAVDFTWIGTDIPGSQPYRIYDPSSFDLLAEGVTSNSAPEPAALWLLGASLGLLTLRCALGQSIAAHRKLRS